MTLIFILFFNVLAVWVANLFVPGFIVAGGLRELFVAGILLGLFNLTIKPIAKFLSAPLIILTLGLFILVINAAIMLIIDYLLDFVTIESLTALIWSTIVIGVVNVITSTVTRVRMRDHRHRFRW